MQKLKVVLACAAVIALFIVALPGGALAQSYPFGSHPIPYTVGTIQPSQATQSGLDQVVADFYDQWKAVYLAPSCGAGRYVVLSAIDAGNLTVSEAHGYGMIIAALMAGHDPAAREIFDGMYAYFREHRTATHDHLMSWYQKRSCADAKGIDSASDGDLDIAYALLLADRQWGSCGAIDYAAEATRVLADIHDGDMDQSGSYVTLGDWVLPDDTDFYAATRSSDFLPAHLRSFAAFSGDPTWTATANVGYGLVEALQTTRSPVAGLIPDFILDPLGTPLPASPDFLEGPTDGTYSYNATRDPWRIALDYLLSGDARAKTIVQRITTWLRSTTGGDATAVRAGYALDGTPNPDSDFVSMAFVAPLAVAAMVDGANQAWLNALWDSIKGTPIEAEGYFENTLKLLAMLAVSGNYWAPDLVAAAACTPPGNDLCMAGGYVPSLRVKITRAGAPGGQARLKLRGDLFFPQGIPVSGDLSAGAQLRLEDSTSGAAALFELTQATTPIPPASAPVCQRRDGWKIKPGKALYKNKSAAMDPPVCTPGSSRGLRKLLLRRHGDSDIDFRLRVRNASIPSATGPVRLTFVLGSDAAAALAGSCAISAAVECTGGRETLRCR